MAEGGAGTVLAPQERLGRAVEEVLLGVLQVLKPAGQVGQAARAADSKMRKFEPHPRVSRLPLPLRQIRLPLPIPILAGPMRRTKHFL